MTTDAIRAAGAEQAAAHRRKKLIKYALIHLGIIAFVCVCVYPLLRIFSVSLSIRSCSCILIRDRRTELSVLKAFWMAARSRSCSPLRAIRRMR